MMERNFVKKSVLLFGAAAVLLVLSTVGSARAALTYYSEDYGMQVSISYIGVSLEENERTVSSRSYDENSQVTEVTGNLLTELGASVQSGGKFLPGKNYDERLSVTNQGQIDSYVRVVVKKSWVDPEGNKNTELSPDLILMDMDRVAAANGWIRDERVSAREGSQAYREQTVYYYARPLAPGESSGIFNETIGVDPAVAGAYSQITEGNKTITVFDYDGYGISLEVEADAVQTHNGVDAIKSAWGVDVDIAADGTLSLR